MGLRYGMTNSINKYLRLKIPYTHNTNLSKKYNIYFLCMGLFGKEIL